jgi:hypothetical protein
MHGNEMRKEREKGKKKKKGSECLKANLWDFEN